MTPLPMPLNMQDHRFDEGACRSLADSNYDACWISVARSRRSKAWKAAAGYPGCAAQLAADYAACAAQAAAQAAQDGLDWARSHPGAVIGTIVVVGGVAMIVVATGGGALALTPVLAL